MGSLILKLGKALSVLKLWIALLPKMLRQQSILGSKNVTFIGDGFMTTRPFGGFEPGFVEAFNDTFSSPVPSNMSRFKYTIWRAHIYTWALRNSLSLKGDCVELGVWWGMFPYTALKVTNIHDKIFHLVDAFGLDAPDSVHESLHIKQEKYNKDIFSGVQEKFKGLPVQFHRGYVPEILKESEFPDKICFLSMDLNNYVAEKEGIEILWDKIVDGGYIYIDDYGCQGYENTRKVYDEFFSKKGCTILKTPFSSALVHKISANV